VPDVPLPDYVVGQAGLTGIQVDVPKDSNVTSVALLATKDSAVAGAYVNGTRVPFFRGVERGHPIFELQMALLPGQPVEVKFELSEPTSAGAPRVPIQPLLDNVVPVVSVPDCS
jgi:hypothetical protein